jgi:hypothetical protein
MMMKKKTSTGGVVVVVVSWREKINEREFKVFLMYL